MKKVIINENQKGFLFHNGRFVKLLGAGKLLAPPRLVRKKPS